MPFWYLSFARPDTDPAWAGFCVVEAAGIAEAVTRAHILGINPGGEVLGVELEEDVGVEWCDKLFRTLEDCKRLDAAIGGGPGSVKRVTATKLAEPQSSS